MLTSNPCNAQDYRVVVTGHSLGAGVASLLAILLRPKYPKLHCFAYGPPGCIVKYVTICLTGWQRVNPFTAEIPKEFQELE